MKSLLGKIATLALVGMAGVAVTACSSSLDKNVPGEGSAKQNEHVGTVSLALQPVAGITVNTVHYIVTAGNPTAVPAPAVVSEGNLPTPGTADNFSFGIPLPVGTGYYISLSGESAETGDNITCTGGYGPFGVTPNTSTPFQMTLSCVDNTSGQIVTSVDVTTDACPRLVVDYAVAEPGTATAPGGVISVHSLAHNLDVGAPATITYAWSVVNPLQSGVGSFGPAVGANTAFTCANPGDSVAIKVTATNYQCSKSLQTVISCASLTCGNGVVDTALGETCNPGAGPGHPADAGCPSDCTKVCGDGNAEGSETCNPPVPNPAVCFPPGSPTECTVRTANCGDGFVTAPEACDGNVGPGGVALPAGSTCINNCTAIQGPVCGDGVQSGSETCDGGTGTAQAPVPAPTRECSPQCERVSTAACVSCEQAGNCFASSDNCKGPAATPFTSAQVTTCYDVMQCIEDSNCLDGATGSLGGCYCGTLAQIDCQSAAFGPGTLPGGAPDLTRPNGPCAAIMMAGSPSLTSNVQILGGLTNKTRPGGAAGQRLNCDKTDAACAPLCGVQ